MENLIDRVTQGERQLPYKISDELLEAFEAHWWIENHAAKRFCGEKYGHKLIPLGRANNLVFPQAIL